MIWKTRRLTEGDPQFIVPWHPNDPERKRIERNLEWESGNHGGSVLTIQPAKIRIMQQYGLFKDFELHLKSATEAPSMCISPGSQSGSVGQLVFLLDGPV